MVNDFLRPCASALYRERRTFRLRPDTLLNSSYVNRFDKRPNLTSSTTVKMSASKESAMTAPAGNFEPALPPRAVFLRIEEAKILRETL